MKLKGLFNGKNRNNGIEISGSFGGQASEEILLGDETGKTKTKTKTRQRDSWSGRDDKNDDAKANANPNARRGRSSSRVGLRRSSSERQSFRKRSKSEVGKRLKKLGDDIGASMKKVAGSKSVGGTFRGKTRDVNSRIDAIALERAGSDTQLQPSSFDSLFGQSQSERTERTCITTATQSKKKLRGGRRKSTIDDTNLSKSGEGGTRRRSKSTSTRNKRSSSTVSTSRRQRSSSNVSKARIRRSTSDVGSTSRKKRSSSAKPRGRASKVISDSGSVATKESTTKKKKKKKKKIRDGSDASEASIPSNVELDDISQVNSSVTMNESDKGKKKTKEKEKSKKTKRSKSKVKYPELPADDFGDGLEGLAEEFRRSKKKYDEEKAEQDVSDYPSDGVPNTSNGGKLFESAWNEIEQRTTANDKNTNPFEDEKKQNHFGEDASEDANMLRQAVDFEVKQPGTSEQQEEILKLQQQLSTALQKHLTMSEEHIKEKNEFMNVSRDLERMRVEVMQSQEEQHEIMEELKERDRIIEVDRNKIDNLEHAIDEQLGKEEELMKSAQQSEEEVEHLLEELQKFESKLDDGETGGGGASFAELRNAKKALAERDKYVASQKLKIEQLEEELKDSMTVPQLQIAELDQENTALQGRLKGERLEYTSKLTTKDDIIQSLRSELATYTASPDAQDLQSALQKLTDAREDAKAVRGDLAAAVKKNEELHGEREDFMEEFNLLKDNNVFMEKTVKDLTEKADGLAKKILVWTEKTYDWKQRADTAERKIKEGGGDKEKSRSETGKPDPAADPQGMFLEAAMEKEKSGEKGSWGIFKRNPAQTKDLSAEEVRIRVLEEQNLDFEAKIAKLNSDLVKMQTGHKDELYKTKKQIAQLEGENEVLALQNSTLEQL